jgi:glycosyltransferase involved in cell wall biosynthesis
MRLAILHDYLNQLGGAERVLQALLELFPEAHLYTLFYDEEKTGGIFQKRVTKTSFLDFPFARKNHRFFIPLMPMATKLIKGLHNYDLIISSTAGYAKGMNIKAPYHISYCHSPLRYAWETDFLKNLPFAPWPLKEFVVQPIAGWLKNWDKRVSTKVNLFVANSTFIAQKIKNYYGRESEVIYPPIDTKIFYPEPITTKKDYYLMVGRLLYYKGFDLGIEAFNRLKKPLKIVGAGPEEKKLKPLAHSPLIEFVPPVSDNHLRILYSNAKALIFPQIEDFGLVAAEAQACGLPVLAFGRGGATEIVENGKTGLFFHEQTPEAIIASVLELEHMRFDRNIIANSALRFSKREFKKKFASLIAKLGFPVLRTNLS